MSDVNAKRQSAWFGIDPEADAAAPVLKGPFAGVVFNRPLDQIFSYRVPEGLAPLLTPGQRVKVPLGRGNTPSVGYCVRVDSRLAEGVDPAKVKDLLEILDNPPLIDANMLELTRWLANYYACAWGQTLDAVVPAGVKKQAGTRVGSFLVVPEETRKNLEEVLAGLPAKQAEALAVLAKSEEPLTVSDLCRLARCAPGPVGALRKRGFLHVVKRRTKAASPDATPHDADEANRSRPSLTDEQQGVLDRLTPALEGNTFNTFLIHGVTGSGKTEVYLSAIEKVVARGREAIVLVPEISLTPQTIRRFKRRFPRVAVLHSHLSDAERHRHWQSIASGEIQVVVGARSAVFAPTRRLGLIVIDEEHESTFKQETTPRYHARDVAVKRAQLERVPVLLGSATPALETWRNAQVGRYTRLSMMDRVGGRPMPEVALIDLRHEKLPLGGLSEPLRQAMIRALDEGGQVILLLNRRGFHTYVICPNPKCGQVLKCDACDVSLTYHKGRRLLICHACDAERPTPPACPYCNNPKLYYGGIGTERLERFLDDRWGDSAPGTYNVCLAHITDFFKHYQMRGRLHGNPTLLISRARKRDVLRTVFTGDQRRAIIACAEDESWKINETKKYLTYSNDFVHRAENLKKAAKDKNIDGAALAYVDMTLTCVKCHQYLREQGIRDVPALSTLSTGR